MQHKQTILAALGAALDEAEVSVQRMGRPWRRAAFPEEYDFVVKQFDGIKSAIAAVEAWESAPAAQPGGNLPCPFCGGAVKTKQDDYGREWIAYCEHTLECGEERWWEPTEAEALAAWNRRAPAAQPQPARGQPHVNVPWHPVDAILWDGKSLYADDLAVTIGEGDTALATFVWPQEGDYAVCKRMPPD